MNGKLVWEKDLGDKSMRNEFGEGSTPALYRNRLVVVWDHTKGSFITVLDKSTGKELWRVEPRRNRHVGDAFRRRARRPCAGHRARHEPLHSYDLETGRSCGTVPA